MKPNEIITRALVREKINLITDADASRLSQAVLTALSEAGMVVVPREPTEIMRRALANRARIGPRPQFWEDWPLAVNAAEDELLISAAGKE